MLAVQFAVGSSFLLAEWHNRTTLNDAGLAREFSPAVKEMEADSLVVTAVARAFWDTNSSISYVDLIDHHLAWGTDDDSLFLLTSAIEGKLAEVTGSITFSVTGKQVTIFWATTASKTTTASTTR